MYTLFSNEKSIYSNDVMFCLNYISDYSTNTYCMCEMRTTYRLPPVVIISISAALKRLMNQQSKHLMFASSIRSSRLLR